MLSKTHSLLPKEKNVLAISLILYFAAYCLFNDNGMLSERRS